MIEIKCIGNVYKFQAAYDNEILEYLSRKKYKALIFKKREEKEKCDVYIFDTFCRQAYNAYYELGGVKIRRIDSCSFLEILESFGIETDRPIVYELNDKYFTERSV